MTSSSLKDEDEVEAEAGFDGRDEAEEPKRLDIKVLETKRKMQQP